jgi:hypothetical protein
MLFFNYEKKVKYDKKVKFDNVVSVILIPCNDDYTYQEKRKMFFSKSEYKYFLQTYQYFLKIDNDEELIQKVFQ